MKTGLELIRGHRLLLAVLSLLSCHSRQLSEAASTAPVTSPPPPPSSSSSLSDAETTTTTPSGEGRRRSRARAFLSEKFESSGPTLTLTLRDPAALSTLRSASPSGKATTSDRDGGGSGSGLSSKFAALFRVGGGPSSGTADGRRTSSSSRARASPPFADGYMLDDGEIFLDPPSEEETSSSSSSSRGLFSIRDAAGWWGESLEGCARSVHPEIRQEIRTRTRANDDDDDDMDTRPFPDSLPWLSGASCGMIWSPFPTYKNDYPEGYGHKLLSVPHFVRCGARVSLPRLSAMVRRWRSTSRGIASDFTATEGDGAPAATRDMDLGVSYRESPDRPGGVVELLLGRRRASLPAFPAGEDRRDGRGGDNHLLLRFAATPPRRGGRRSGDAGSVRSSIASSIERAEASFRVPAPFFRGGLSVSPSFDFARAGGGTAAARCVLSGAVGSSGGTRAVLRLNAEEDSTLTVVRSLDESKIIAPTISLNSGKIVYDYYLNLDGVPSGRSGRPGESDGRAKSSLRAHVDPTEGILLKWTDGVRGGRRGGGGGSWVAECRVPLGTTAAGPLAADVRVGRRWVI